MFHEKLAFIQKEGSQSSAEVSDPLLHVTLLTGLEQTTLKQCEFIG